ncbi:TIGR03943 family protein [Microbacterium sp. C7(2022)]|uniref:TIGR03943 family putative permease subunit n=1 Tax=Microbacterium sp. C7(2022) TaxID=2992759 RepID=UPI00237B90E0|nr:TIGR03943 family protein [Microbacterium sp. C7(2022)]MDE0546390.1 TIGR03943 family protein [Microbacterium sp. C7(2022)]
MPDLHSLATRWLGVGLASILSVVTLSLAFTDRLGLYINPDSTWFAVSMAIFVLVGAIASFALPLGAEADHGHDHGDAPAPAVAHDRGHPGAIAASAVGGVAASGIVVLTLVLPPASLSAELAMSRDTGAAPLFAGQDTVALATTGDTDSFGVGEWASVFATATNPDAFDGDEVELTGFVTPGDGGEFDLTRLVITHCVIDAQPASLPVVGVDAAPETGQWVTITGTVRASSDGRLAVDAASVTPIDEPENPYEF